MVATEYVRRGRTIRTIKTGAVETFKTIAAATRQSRQLQGTNLGNGLLKKDSN